MRHEQAYKIAMAAASLAIAVDDEFTIDECYAEYYDQLINNDYQCLVYWLGHMIAGGSRAAGEIILKKYSPIGEMSTFAKQYAESLSQVSGHAALITDRDQFIAASGGFKNILGKSLSAELEDRINRKDVLIASKEDKNFVRITDDAAEEYNQEAICPIICEGDVIRAVMLLESEEKEKMGKVEQALVLCVASFIGKLMEGDDAEWYWTT